MIHPTHPPVDMSPEAIAQRLEELSDLYEFSKSIRTAKYVGPAETSSHRPLSSATGGDDRAEQNSPRLKTTGG